jgi:hypothetical protein
MPEKDCDSAEEAADRVHWLNGGNSPKSASHISTKAAKTPISPIMAYCLQLIEEGRPIAAIRADKEATGCSLAEAKNILLTHKK